MTTQKQPMAGEWWQADDGSRAYIIGVKRNGEVMFEDENFQHFNGGDDWSDWQHLPDCDSWTWQPEVFPKWYVHKKPELPWCLKRPDKSSFVCCSREGQSQRILDWNDEHDDIVSDGEWIEVTEAEALARVKPAEVWPQYWTKSRFSNDKVAYVELVADSQWIVVYTDGHRSRIQNGLFFSVNRKQLTKEQAEALIDKGNQEAAGNPQESPYDYVIQDRVPMRATDEMQWSTWSKDYWCIAGFVLVNRHNGKLRHGYVDDDGLTLSVRCLRKDLPPIPSPKRVPVRLFINAVTHNVYGCSVPDRPESDKEVYSDGNGSWYVEVQS